VESNAMGLCWSLNGSLKHSGICKDSTLQPNFTSPCALLSTV
jgi:hypothetical protein